MKNYIHRIRKMTAWLLAVFLAGSGTLCSAPWPGNVAAADEIIMWEESAQDQEETEKAPGIKPSELYARSAVLMDAGSGRILFAKNGTESMAMASTTKILTCILALENGDMSARVNVTAEAAAQPEVKLGMREGQSFYLKDLLYSLMLESHNDSAAAIAEHIGGSLPAFADMMNKKAEEIGCRDSYFITPNGLDASDESGFHHTTAEDLALIMRYCIMLSEQKEEFLEITRTESYSFTDCGGTASYDCTNHNTFLKMMEGALSGKTGFTSEAGYCYVGALQRDERTFIVALLACGWPNNKGYKWSDTKKLMTYALENYEYREINPPSLQEDTVLVDNGFSGGFPQKTPVSLPVKAEGEPRRILLEKGETVGTEYHLESPVNAPVGRGDKLGSAVCTVNGETIAVFSIIASETVVERNAAVCASYILRSYLTGG